ncbi:ComEC/Rec2 family competence protein [Sandaracinobacteroides saxicola]|uniref:ComEC/Rec2 family competence protein n=1 Tax=Sandaracinobacteroides saxicola TaxID=2759707 RepID=A0A7G5IEN4_9SPHN|nr:ComEC/Rec2 family competence protein [Sandaracinobacteroides saxicola]QMW21826.1 ComEC/Rec2 family competence protein [Sandaracinobacteroides saxicola]
MAADHALWPERDALILFAPLLLAAGIAAWFLLPWLPQRQAASGIGVAVALLGLLFRGFLRPVLLCAGLLFAAGVVLADVRSNNVAAPRLHFRLSGAEVSGTVTAVEGRVDGAGGEAPFTRLLLAADAMPAGATLRLRMAGLPPDWLRPGARLAAKVQLQPPAGPQVPGGYDFSRRAWFMGVGASGQILGAPHLLRAAPAPPGVAAWLALRRLELTGWLAARVGGREGGIAAALVTGDQGRIDARTVAAMRDSGLAHLLSVSGYHIAVVVGASLWLFRRLLARWEWLALRVSVRTLAALGAGVMGTLYTLIAGAEVPAVRACLMAWVVVAALVLGRDPLSLRLIAFAAFVILLARPEAALNPSFQLSFAAVVALVSLYQSAWGRRLFPLLPEDAWWTRWGRRGAALLLSGLVIEAMLAPVALFHFGRAGLYGTLANLLGIPLTSVAIMPALGGMLAAGAVGLEAPFAWAARQGIGALIGLAEAVAGLPGAVARLGAVPVPAFGLMLAGMLLLALLSTRARLLGMAPLLAGGMLALVWPAPDLMVSADGRHVALVRDGRLLTLRAAKGGFATDSMAEAAGVSDIVPLGMATDARCNDLACALPGPGASLLALRSAAALERASLLEACAAADIVVSDRALPAACRPRWLLLDKVTLRSLGAVAVDRARRRWVSAGALAGDHPWSPAAPVSRWRDLLGKERWTEPIS